MARYDGGWGGWEGHGRATRYEWGPAWGGPEGRGVGYERDAGTEVGIYGPARYGLGPYHDRLRQRRRPDGELREEVEDALFYDTWVDAAAITVDVSDGIVTLRGELPSYEEIRFATDDAWDVDGVVGVHSELGVRGR